jgi:hypothetical protein
LPPGTDAKPVPHQGSAFQPSHRHRGGSAQVTLGGRKAAFGLVLFICDIPLINDGFGNVLVIQIEPILPIIGLSVVGGSNPLEAGNRGK